MEPYTIVLSDENGSVRERRTQWFKNSDDAVDYAGKIDHPYEVRISQAGRLVAQIPGAQPLRALETLSFSRPVRRA